MFCVFLLPFTFFIITVSDTFLRSFILFILLPFILLTVLSFVVAKLTYRFYKYELTDVDFRKEHGIIWKKYVSIPYHRIQNVDIHRGVIARILGLSDINIQTAGSSAVMGRYGINGIGAEGYLPGLSQEVAEQLRDTLIKKTQPSTNQGL